MLEGPTAHWLEESTRGKDAQLPIGAIQDWPARSGTSWQPIPLHDPYKSSIQGDLDGITVATVRRSSSIHLFLPTCPPWNARGGNGTRARRRYVARSGWSSISRALIEFTCVGPTLLTRHLVARVVRLGKAGHPANVRLAVESSSS
jgi:hypothetical protein